MCNSLVLLLFWSSVNVNLQNRVDWITRNECDWTCSFGWFVVGVGCSYSFSLSGNLVLNSASVKCEGVRCGSRGYHFHSHRIGLTCHSIQAMWKCISTSCHSIKLGLLAASSPYMRLPYWVSSLQFNNFSLFLQVVAAFEKAWRSWMVVHTPRLL